MKRKTGLFPDQFSDDIMTMQKQFKIKFDLDNFMRVSSTFSFSIQQFSLL